MDDENKLLKFGIIAGIVVVLALAFFQLSDRRPRTLMHFVIAGVVFAVANQVGNNGSIILAAVLIFAGAAYAVLVARR